MELTMDYTTDKIGKKAQAKAAKLAKRQSEQPQSIAALIEAGMLENAFDETQCGNCDKMRKANYIWGLAFWFMVFVYLIFGVAAVTLVNAHQVDVGNSHAGEAPKLIARGIEVDTTTSVVDSACTVSTSITFPAPSAAFVTKTVDGAIVTETADGVTATGDVTVTPIASQTTTAESVCSSPETVTVTVTTVTDNDAMTAGAGGAPPQSSEAGATTTTDSSVLSTVTVTESYTVTNTATMGTTTASTTSEGESTTQAMMTSTSTTDTATTTQHTTTTTQFITVLNSTGTTTTTLILNDPSAVGTVGTASLITTLGSMLVGDGSTSAGTVGTMFNTAGGPQPSTNGSFTYSVPAVSASSVLPTIVSSSGSSSFSSLALRGAGGAGDGGKRGDLQRGGSSGFYCVVMAVACAVAVLV